jgi:hypothetical protein
VAEIFLIKDGTSSDHRTTGPYRVAVEKAAEKLTPFEKRYYDDPPEINPAHGPALRKDEYRHVIVKIDEAEINAIFPDAGYYQIVALTPEDCHDLFGISAPRH